MRKISEFMRGWAINGPIRFSRTIKTFFVLFITLVIAVPIASSTSPPRPADQWGNACATNPAGSMVCADSLDALKSAFNARNGLTTDWDVLTTDFAWSDTSSDERTWWTMLAKPKAPDVETDFYYTYGAQQSANWSSYSAPPSCTNGCGTEAEVINYLQTQVIPQDPDYTSQVVGEYSQSFTLAAAQVGDRLGGSSGTLNFTGTRRLEVYYKGGFFGAYPLNKLKAYSCNAPYLADDRYGTPPGITESTLCGGFQFQANQSLLQKESCAVNANPCYPATGDKARFEVDFEFAGRPFTRNYHSTRQATSTGLSQGWSFTYGGSVELDGSSEVDEQGYVQTYGSFSGQRRPSLSTPNRYMDQTSTGFTSSSSDGTYHDYNFNGWLLGIRVPNAPTQNVSINRDSSHRVSELVDAQGRKAVFGYDGAGHLASITLPNGSSINYQYDGNGDLAVVQYPDGKTKQYLYNEANLAPAQATHLLTGIVDENSVRYATFSYDARQRVISSRLNNGASTVSNTVINYSSQQATVTTDGLATRTFGYTTGGNLLSATNSLSSQQIAYTYDSYGYVSSVNTNGVIESYVNTASGQRIANTQAQGTTVQRRTETDWHATFDVPIARRVLNASGTLMSKEAWTYNSRGQALTSAQIDPSSSRTSRTVATTYCENAATCGLVGLVLSIDGPRTDLNDVTTFSYYLSDDPSCASVPATCPHRQGDLWKVTNALGQVTETLAYDSAGRTLSVKDPNGVITDYTYTPRGWLSSKTIRGGGVGPDRQTRIEYWPTGLVSFVYQPDNSFTAFTYDNAHRLTDVFDNAGNKIHYTLDSAGNRTQEDTNDPNGALTRTLSRVYNQLGQLQQSLTANSHATTYTYDLDGNTIGISDAFSRNNGNTYDPLGRLAQTLQDTSGINASTQFTYDTNDRLTQVKDPKGLLTNYTYSGLGDLTQLSSPDTGLTAFTYDAAGNRLTQTDARSIKATFAYDALNRLNSISYKSSAFNQTYAYDAVQSICPAGEQAAKGFMTKMQAKGAITQFCYDRWGQLVRKMQTVGSLAQVTRYLYDAYGRLQGLIYPDGGAVDYMRNALGQIMEVGYTPVNGSRSVVVTGVTYAPFGPATGWTYGNSRHLDRTLTLDYRPNVIYDSQAGGLSYAYGFDAVGNLGALKDGTQTTDLGKFVYDGLNRLTQQQNGSGSPLYTWSYDATGNRTQAQGIVGGTLAYTYSATDHRLSKVGTATRSYDAGGNTTGTGTGLTLTYGSDNRMSVAQAGATSVQYAYDGRGQQVQRTVGSASSVFAYDEAGHWLGEYSSTGTAKQQVVWLDDMPVGVVTMTNNIPVLAYIEPDHLGTPRAIIDPTRNVAVWSWPITSEAFGNAQPDQDPDGDGTLFAFNLRFPGQRYDSVTGLNYNMRRDYDAAIGRYIESDPIGFAGGLNTFSYSEGTPLNAYDSSGLAAIRIPPLGPNDPVPDGTVYCENGAIKPFLNTNSFPPQINKCLGDCAWAHEISHVKDAQRTNPNVCKRWSWLPADIPFNHPRGLVTFPDEPDGVYEHPERFRSEFTAYAAELNCLVKKLASAKCDSDGCRPLIEQRIYQIRDDILPTVRNHTYGAH